jgi:hypothetical protein
MPTHLGTQTSDKSKNFSKGTQIEAILTEYNMKKVGQESLTIQINNQTVVAASEHILTRKYKW